jgi:hypothetical protein
VLSEIRNRAKAKLDELIHYHAFVSISRLIQLRKSFNRTEYNFNGAIIQIQLKEIFMKSEGNINCVSKQIQLRVILNFELSTCLLYEKSKLETVLC